MLLCFRNLGETVVKYGCLPGGGCNYLAEGDEYPYAGFCTFKEVVNELDCSLPSSGSTYKVRQWRAGEHIWTGDVMVWPGGYGRREPRVDGAFHPGDEITPWALTDGPTSSPSGATQPPTMVSDYGSDFAVIQLSKRFSSIMIYCRCTLESN